MLAFIRVLAANSNPTEKNEQENSMSGENEQEEDMQEQVHTQYLAYWQKQLAHSSEFLDLPTDHQQPFIPNKHRSRFSFVLTAALSKEIREFSCHEGTTLYTCLLTTFQALLHSYTGQTDLLLASPMTFYKTQPLHIRILQNTLVLRTNLSHNPTFYELLTRTHRVVAQARVHHEIPYAIQLQQIQPTYTGSRKPPVRVAFSLQAPLPVLLPGWTMSQVNISSSSTDFDLSLVLDSRLETLSGYFEYNADIFKKSTIERMQGNWQTVLTSIMQGPSQHLSDITPL